MRSQCLLRGLSGVISSDVQTAFGKDDLPTAKRVLSQLKVTAAVQGALRVFIVVTVTHPGLGADTPHAVTFSATHAGEHTECTKGAYPCK